MGVAGALRGPARDRALPQPRGRPVRPPPPHPLRRRGSPPPCSTSRRAPGRSRSATAPRSGPGSSIAATGVLSVPYLPDVPGRDDFRGEAHHTGRWPAEPVDFAGKRVAVIGTSSSGVQVVPAIARRRRRRSPCTSAPPTGARRSTTRPITAEEQAQLRADFEELREVLNTSISGFAHPVNDARRVRRLAPRSGGRSSRQMWNSPGFMKLTSNYADLLFNEAANAEWCEFIADKIRGIVHDPDDRRAADPQGPPLRREAAAVRHRLLRGVQRPEGVARRPPRDADRAGDRDRHRDDRRRARVRHHRVGDRLRLRHRRADPHGDPRAATGSRSPSTGPTARRRSSACRPAGSRTSSSPAARTPPPATTRATTATRSTSSPTCSCTRRERGYDVIEVYAPSPRSAGPAWSTRARPRPRSGRSASTSAATSPASRGATC